MSRIVAGNVAAFDDTSYTPNRDGEDRGPNQPIPAKSRTKTSRITRQHTSATVTTGQPYRFIEPFTWVDGNLYGEGELRQQFIANLQEIPHVYNVVQENIVDSDGFDAEPYYVNDSMIGTVALGANETWWFLEVVRWSGAGAPGTDQVRFGWYTPLGATIAGIGPTIDGSGTPYAHDISFNFTGADYLEWEENTSLPEHQNNTIRLTWMELYVKTGSTAGNFSAGFSSITSPATTVYAGSFVLGMRVSP